MPTMKVADIDLMSSSVISGLDSLNETSVLCKVSYFICTFLFCDFHLTCRNDTLCRFAKIRSGRFQRSWLDRVLVQVHWLELTF